MGRGDDYPYTEYSYSSSDLYTYTDSFSFSASVSGYGTTGAWSASGLNPSVEASETLVAIPRPARTKRI